jgi:hypothetical protein
LIALAARKFGAKQKKRLARNLASLSVKENYQAIGILGPTPNAVNASPPAISK